MRVTVAEEARVECSKSSKSDCSSKSGHSDTSDSRTSKTLHCQGSVKESMSTTHTTSKGYIIWNLTCESWVTFYRLTCLNTELYLSVVFPSHVQSVLLQMLLLCL